MGETTNYQLYVTDDDTTNFKDWREKLNGTTDSNMAKIDSALAEKAERSSFVSETLLANGWIGEAAPFQQTIAIDGLTAQHNGSASVAAGATPEELEAAQKAALRVSGQADGALTITADGVKPVIDIPIVVILIG